ncbi:hypothetical protein GOP47_0006777 [Adiantum capillus-veneris]|uniref:DNA mismatch repair protein S5 domain-containing protein n=1 Tax=Adiantum capillus-veneris TaxID=13818 RepID=A0A9D4ZMT6_ADICA|nr:hypothetical protein GOP47_0006777 [Adiantum capillus-veneris]
MGYIAHLPKSVIGQLRSSSILSDLAQAVEELICNSLDAGAKKICVYVDLPSFFIKVEDDGSGVARDDLKLIGERHATSKLHDMVELESGVATLGFRGEALSSLSDIGVVEIITRTRGSPNTYKKIMKASKKLSLGLYGEQRAPGTTVVLRELFHNLPVRRKVIQSSPRKVLQAVKDRTLRLALIHPDVSFRVFDMDRLENLICTKTCSSSLDILCEFFGEHLRHELHELHFAKECLKLDAFISKETSRFSSKAVQFLYLNGRFVHKTPVHKLINTLFLHSNCGQELANPFKSDFSCPGVKQALPMFLINLHCPLSTYDITFEATKTSVEFKDWKSILSFITEALGTKWRRLTRNLDEDCHSSKHGVIRKRKMSWQHVDPSYRTRCTKDMKKGDVLCLAGGMQNAGQAVNKEQDLTFCTPKGIRSPRKKKAYQEHNVTDLSIHPWSFQPCSTRRKLDSDVRYTGSQHDPGGMENLWSQKDSLQGFLRETSTGDVLGDDVLDCIVGPKSQGLSGQDVLCQNDSKNLCYGESTNAVIDFMQTPPQLRRSFSVSSPGVRRCLYELNMTSSCADDFWCHSERQTISNLEIPYNRERLWNNDRGMLCIDFPRHGFAKGYEREVEEGGQLDYLLSFDGNDRLVENKSSLYPQQWEIEKFDSTETPAVNKFSFLGKEGKASPYPIVIKVTVDELKERPESKQIGGSGFLTLSTHCVDKEIVCKKRGRNSPKHSSRQIVSKNIPVRPSSGRLRRSLSAPPFHQPPIKYGASNGIFTLKCPRENHKLQADVEVFVKAQGFSTADTEKVAQNERRLASPMKDGRQSSTAEVEFTSKKRRKCCIIKILNPHWQIAMVMIVCNRSGGILSVMIWLQRM